jgi:UDP-3-O-[3-hydroxymyristoyl] glucosamine N-acyltransferase
VTGWTTGELARQLGLACEGPPDRVLRGVSSLENAGPAELAFCVGGRWAAALASSAAGAVIVPVGLDVPPGSVALRAADPRYSYARAAALLHPQYWPAPGIHPTAVVAEDASISADATVEAYVVVGAGAVVAAGSWLQSFVYVGAGASVGRRCRLMPGAVLLERCVLGDEVQVHPGAVIGADGFGHVAGAQGLVRVPHLGRVVIADEVEVGSNSCVDRAALGETTVGRSTRLDNFVQIAHGASIGADCRLAAFVGVAGGAVVEDEVVMGGRSAVVDGVHVGKGASFAGLASASRDVPANARIGGSPARAYRRWLRELAALQQLPDLLREVERLKRRIADLEGNG